MVPFNGHGYYFSWHDRNNLHKCQLSWGQARDFCRSICLDLVAVESPREDEFLAHHIRRGIWLYLIVKLIKSQMMDMLLFLQGMCTAPGPVGNCVLSVTARPCPRCTPCPVTAGPGHPRARNCSHQVQTNRFVNYYAVYFVNNSV